MRFEDDTLHAKTGPDFFTDEKGGGKPFTLRLVSEDEWHKIRDWWQFSGEPRYIEIAATFSGDSFRRPIRRIGRFGDFAGSPMIYISWGWWKDEGAGE